MDGARDELCFSFLRSPAEEERRKEVAEQPAGVEEEEKEASKAPHHSTDLPEPQPRH